MAFNYGGRDELLDAVRALARQVKTGELDPDDITEKHVEQRPLHGRRAGPRSAHPDQRGDADLELPAVADRVHRAVDHADPVARFRSARSVPGHRGVSGTNAPLRRGVMETAEVASVRGAGVSSVLRKRVVSAVVLIPIDGVDRGGGSCLAVHHASWSW